eukprot:gene2842-1076_t
MAAKSEFKSLSLVWQFFSVEKTEDESAMCNICKRRVKRGQKDKGPKSYSTAPLHNHLKRWHTTAYNSAYADFKKGKEETKGLSSSLTPMERKLKEMQSVQSTLQGSFAAKRIWDITDQRSLAISKKIMKMMVSDNQPFSIVVDQGFIELIAHLEPHYLIPSRKYFTQDALPKLYSETCGLAQSPMSHWLDEDFNYKSAMLNARHFPGRHTGGLIESNFNIMLGEWSIDHSRIQMLVRDGASNIALGARLSELDSIHCFINRLQLCIESSILSQRSVSDMCAKARKIVTHFHHSSQACTTFKNIQIENGSKQPLLLVQDVKMRWNSTFLMLQRLSILKATVQLYAGDNEIPILTANEWQLMDKVLRLLQPFFEITKKVSGEQSILSAVIPDVAALDRYLTKYTTKDSGVHTLKEELRQELKRRFFSPNEQELDVTYSKPYVVSTLLDPRFKGKFVSVKSLSNGRGMLLEDMKKAALVQKSAEEKGDIKNNTDEENCAPGHKKKKLETLQEEIHYDFSACYDEISEQNDHVLGSANHSIAKTISQPGQPVAKVSTKPSVHKQRVASKGDNVPGKAETEPNKVENKPKERIAEKPPPTSIKNVEAIGNDLKPPHNNGSGSPSSAGSDSDSSSSGTDSDSDQDDLETREQAKALDKALMQENIQEAGNRNWIDDDLKLTDSDSD